MAEKVNLQQKIQQYRQANPKLKNLSDEKILSIMVQNGVISLTEEEQRSVFGNNKPQNNNMGLQVEKTAKKTNTQKTIYLQSGRKVVYSKTANGKIVMRYYGTDGTQLNPDYFKKVEGQISISEDGNTYTITKNGKKTTLQAKDPSKGAIEQNLARLNNEEKRLKKTKNEQGFIGSSWDWIKNTTGIGDGSDKAQKQIEAERKLLNQVKTGKISKKDFKEVTGVEYSQENLEKFKRGELSQATAKIDGYKEGQEMASDVAGDMISGIAAVGIYTAAVAAAPFTGGASIAVGVAAATASGALIKAGVKALDAKTGGRKYSLKDFGHDTLTGGFSGLLAPITGGMGGAVGKTVATKLGIQAVKQVGKEVAEEAVEQGVKQGLKQGLKTALTNPTGYEYVGGTLVKRGTALAAEMATDGALGGAIDGGFRAGLDNNWDANAILSGTIEGGIGGAIMAPIIGGGMKAAGKGAQKIFGKNNVHIDANKNIIRTDVINSLLKNEIDIDYAAAVLRNIDDLETALKLAELNLSGSDKVRFNSIKKELVEKVNKNIAYHGSIVLQTEIPAERFIKDSKTGIKYAIARQDDIVLAHAVQNDNAIESLTYLINATKKYDENNYLSLSLINKNSHLFGDETKGIDIYNEYGIIPKVRNIDVTSAGFGQISAYKKDFTTFVKHNSFTSLAEGNLYLKNSFLKKLKGRGYNLTDSDYAQLFNLLKNKQYFSEITNDIKINGITIKADILKNALEESSVELSAKFLYGNGSNNEVSAIIDGIKAIYARVDNIDDVKPEVLALAKNNDLDIVLLGKPTKLEITNLKYYEELNELKILFENKEINVVEFQKRKRNLRNKYEAIEKENLRARTTLEQNSKLSNDILEELLLDNSQAQNL